MVIKKNDQTVYGISVNILLLLQSNFGEIRIEDNSCVFSILCPCSSNFCFIQGFQTLTSNVNLELSKSPTSKQRRDSLLYQTDEMLACIIQLEIVQYVFLQRNLTLYSVTEPNI